MNREIKIICNDCVTDEILFYIADCWIEFITGDLGLNPNDLIMMLPI